MEHACAIDEAIMTDQPMIRAFQELGKTWKLFWREMEKNPQTRKQVRQEKRAARRRFHRESRRKAKEALRYEY